MEFVLNAGLGVGLLLFSLLLFKKGKQLKDYLFLSWIAASLLQIGFYQITIYHFALYGIWAVVSFAIPLLGAPLLFLYIQSLTKRQLSFLQIASHVCIYPIYCLVFYFSAQTSDYELVASQGFFSPSPDSPLWTQYYAVPLAISGMLYCVWDLLLLKKHKQRISQLYSYEEQVDLRWLNYVVYSYFVLFLFASFLVFGGVHFQIFPLKDTFALVGICLCLMLIAFGFYGFHQSTVFSNIPINETTRESKKNGDRTPSYTKSGLNPDRVKVLGLQIQRHMEQQKPFLNEQLTLSMLASQCDCTQAQLSQIVNQHFNKSFYDFVNEYRVEEAKKRLNSPTYEHLSILGIAYDCGFKSKSSFNRYFKKYTGTSPSKFKEKHPQ